MISFYFLRSSSIKKDGNNSFTLIMRRKGKEKMDEPSKEEIECWEEGEGKGQSGREIL